MRSRHSPHERLDSLTPAPFLRRCQMNIASVFKPKPTLSEHEVARGLRYMTWESVASTGFGGITTSGFLTA